MGDEEEHIIIKAITVIASTLTPRQMFLLRRQAQEAFTGNDKALNTVDGIITVAESLRKRREIRAAQEREGV